MENFDYTAFGAEVKHLREKAGLERKEIAREVGMSSRYLQEIEDHGRQCSFNFIFPLCQYFDISLDKYLFPEKGGKKSPTRIHIDRLLDQLNKAELMIIEGTSEAILHSKKYL